MFCSNCGAKSERDWGFCAKCGMQLSKPPQESADNIDPKPSTDWAGLKSSYSDASSNPYKRKDSSGSNSKRKIGCGGIIFLLIFAGLISSAFRSANSPSEGSAEISPTPSASESPKTPITLEEAILKSSGQSLSEFALVNCEASASLDFDAAERRLSEFKSKFQNVETGRQAVKLLKSIKLPSTNFRSEFEADFLKNVNDRLSVIEGQINFDEYVKGGENWRDALASAILENCPLEGDYQETIEALVALENDANRVRTLSANVPWYPDGFSSYSSNLAIKFVKGRGCEYSSASCWNVDVISKDSCSYLYVEFNIFDRSGALIDYTNDAARNVSAGKVVKLSLTTFNDSASTGEITQLTCQ